MLVPLLKLNLRYLNCCQVILHIVDDAWLAARKGCDWDFIMREMIKGAV